MDPTILKRVYPCWILVEPAEDVPGLWVSHCLDFDVISQGDTAEQAVESVCEAVVMTLHDDLSENIDPRERAGAPSEYWERLQKVLAEGKAVRLPDVDKNAKVVLAKQVNFATTVVTIQISATKSNPGLPGFEPVSVSPIPSLLPGPDFICQPCFA